MAYNLIITDRADELIDEKYTFKSRLMVHFTEKWLNHFCFNSRTGIFDIIRDKRDKRDKRDI